MSKILLTGGSGLLGQNVQRCMAKTGDELFVPSRSQMDITNPAAVCDYMAYAKPDVVVHCAAYSKVDLAEQEAELCRAVNVNATDYLTRACREQGSYLLYISSDYVFDGTKQAPYETGDRKKPLSVYGRSKAEGEEIVLRSSEKNCVLRTSWLFGSGGNHFVAAMLRLSQTRDAIGVVCDQVGSPTCAEDLAQLICSVCRQQVPGILHGTNEGFCSWADFAQEIMRVSGADCKINRITSSEYPSAATRPLNSRLSKVSLDAVGLNRLPHWSDALERYFAAGAC